MCHKQITEESFQLLKANIQRQYIEGQISTEDMQTSIHKLQKTIHFCGKIWCNACNDHVSLDNHQCYIGVLNDKD